MYNSHDFRNLTPERLEHIASWAGLDHDVHWHTCLGWILMEGFHCDGAVTHFSRAVELDAQAWVALEGLARCAGQQKRYLDAIELQERAINALLSFPDNISWIAGYLWPQIVTWTENIGDEAKAYGAAINGFIAEPSNLDAQLRVLQKLDEREDFAGVMTSLERMNSSMSKGSEHNWLVRFFAYGQDAFYQIGRACKRQGCPGFVLDAMDEALTFVDTMDERNGGFLQVWLPNKMAYFRVAFYAMKEETTRLWEKFLERLSAKDEDFQKSFATERAFAMNSLAQLYFDASVEELDCNAGSEIAYADKLKSLAVSVATGYGEDYHGFDFYMQDYPSLLWGRWLRDYRKTDEATWKKCFRARLLEEMNSLDDNDPTNDTEGLQTLALSLAHAGDRQNAAAILAILFKWVENRIEANKQKGREVTESVPISSQPDAPLASRPPEGLRLYVSDISGDYACDSCNRTVKEVEEMYLCEICCATNWCGDCLEQLKDPERRGLLSKHFCNPKHDFYRAWPIPEEARYGAAQSFENGIVVRTAWLENLRRKWW